MTYLFSTLMRSLRVPLVLCLMCFVAPLGHSQTTPAVLSGHVTDASMALVPGARLSLECAHAPAATTEADSSGRYSFSVQVSGNCTLAVTAEGFAAYRSAPFAMTPGHTRTMEVKLAVADVQSVDVAPDTGDPTDPSANGDATVLKGKAIDDLPMDTSELQQQLNSLAGGDTPELRVDGFTGGQMPPKSSIREIHINQNPYSAQNDTNPTAGYIEIFTRPGGQEFHGDIYAYGNDSAFNSISPLLHAVPPPYHSFGTYAQVNGPLSKHTSFFLSTNTNGDTSNSIIKAQTLDATGLNQINVTQAVASSSASNSFSVRIDSSIGKKSTVIGRYDVNFSHDDNDGIGNLSLASQGYNSGTMRQTLQLSNSQIISKNIVNDTRFQYVRIRNHQTPASTAPAIIVQGSFNGGGANTGNFRDNTDRYELQSYTSAAAGKHFLNFGFRFRDTRDANSSTANYNGQYIFSAINDANGKTLYTALDVYQKTLQGVAGFGPSQYSVTVGKPSVAVNVADAGLYLQDDWKVRPNLTLSPGLRYETQNYISDHADWAPRLGAAYSFGGAKGKPAKYVLRGGAGLFYTRFASSSILQAARQNGVTQTQYVVANPTYPIDPTKPLGGGTSPTTFQINPKFQSPRLLAAGVSIQRMFGQMGSLTLGYTLNRGRHSQVTRNINAPLPGTYVYPDASSGVRPLGGTNNIYEYDSNGDYTSHRLALNWFVNYHSKVFVYGNYQINVQHSDTWGSFAAHQYDLAADYGRAPTPTQTLNVGGGVNLPWGFRVGPYLVVRNGRPFNITTGTDLNGDAQYNDRPSFATDLTRPSVVHTAYGTFDTQPIAGQTIIPVNYGMGPSTLFLYLNANKTFKIGPRVKPEAPKAGAAAKAPAKVKIDRKWELSFGANAQNLLNHPNYAPPVGTLNSSFFGQYVTLSGGFGPAGGSANRSVQIQTSFNF